MVMTAILSLFSKMTAMTVSSQNNQNF